LKSRDLALAVIGKLHLDEQPAAFISQIGVERKRSTIGRRR